MKYYLDGKIHPLEDGTQVPEGKVLIEIIGIEEYKSRYQGNIHQVLMEKSIYSAQYCKADLLRDCVVGTFVIPRKEELLKREATFGYYMTKEKLVFVEDGDEVKKMVDHLVEVQFVEKTYVAHFFFEFMEYLIREDVLFLQEFEQKLSVMEEKLLKGGIKNFNSWVLMIRKELLVLDAYYRQLEDVSETLEGNENRMFSQEDCRLFGLYANRVSRLHENTHVLKEYSLQLREMYQTHIEVRQNKIMQFLTVVTTIFMPLTLIVGWYGMNFVHMPELQSRYGYPILIVVSIAIILLEIWYFKIKKWLD
ncbi:magnesium transporter CorA family protein [Lachnospiraceae bacterium LCP25S3_G4]